MNSNKIIPTPHTSSSNSLNNKKNILNYRERLLAFHSQYNVPKLSEIDFLLIKYKGKEEQFLRAMSKKYGPEPKHNNNNNNNNNNKRNYEKELTKILKQHNPERLPEVYHILLKYKGKEEALLQALREKYSKETNTEITKENNNNNNNNDTTNLNNNSNTDFHIRLTEFLRKYDPKHLNNISSILLKYKGKEEAMMRALVKKFGPEPTILLLKKNNEENEIKEKKEITSLNKEINNNNNTELEETLREFFSKYDESKLKGNYVKEMSYKYRDKPNVLLKALAKKYESKNSTNNSVVFNQKEEKEKEKERNNLKNVTLLYNEEIKENVKIDSELNHSSNNNNINNIITSENEKEQTLIIKEDNNFKELVFNYIIPFNTEWKLSLNEELEMSQRLEEFFHPNTSNKDSLLITLNNNNNNNKSKDPLSSELENIEKEELKQWRENKLRRSELIAWSKRKPIM